jgi:anti-sigma factor RsiW
MRHLIRKLFRRSSDGPMDCHQVGELMQYYLDGQIDDERARRIEEHLEDCRRCGLELETYERIKASLASRRGEVPDESIERLREFARRLARGEEPSTP